MFWMQMLYPYVKSNQLFFCPSGNADQAHAISGNYGTRGIHSCLWLRWILPQQLIWFSIPAPIISSFSHPKMTSQHVTEPFGISPALKNSPDASHPPPPAHLACPISPPTLATLMATTLFSPMATSNGSKQSRCLPKQQNIKLEPMQKRFRARGILTIVIESDLFRDTFRQSETGHGETR